jgi:DNA transposition AAA+ family ATPase
MNIAKKALAIQEFSRMIENMQHVNLEDIDSSVLPKNFKPTKAFGLCLDGMKRGLKRNAPLIGIGGANGAGKTSACRYFAHTEGVMMTEVATGVQPKHLLQMLCKRLGVDSGTGWMMQVEIVLSHLKSSPRTIILDEAQRLSYDSFDLLKYLGDNSGSVFILVGSASMLTRIERWPDIDSRCPVKIKVEPLDVDEFVELYRPDGFQEEALVEIHDQCKGIMRNVVWLLIHIEDALGRSKITKSELTPAHIRSLANKFF